MNFKWYQSGNIFGIRYWMRAGEEIPTHAHPYPELEHNIVVLLGSVRLTTDNHDTVLENCVHDFDGKKPHSITCISDEAMTLHLFLLGMPDGYAQLPEAERQGTL